MQRKWLHVYPLFVINNVWKPAQGQVQPGNCVEVWDTASMLRTTLPSHIFGQHAGLPSVPGSSLMETDL